MAAWSHLRRAHAAEVASRGFQAEQEIDRVVEMSEQVQSIFQKGFWPAGVGSSSRVPVFIVGMMR